MRYVLIAIVVIILIMCCYFTPPKPVKEIKINPYMSPISVRETYNTYELDFEDIKLIELKDLNKNDYAYVTLMFPSITNGVKTYKFLLGMLVVAYLLKHNPQNYGLTRHSIHSTRASVVCMVTHDVEDDVVEILGLFYDRVIKVPYITPSFIESVNSITINDVTKAYHADDHCYNKVMTKLNMFNPDLLPYKKVIFLDGDMLPLTYFDTLFSLPAPAGWLETFRCPENPNLTHGHLIPHKHTDIDKIGTDVNASLLVIEPNRKLYDSMIDELQSPLSTWFGKDKIHNGMWFNNIYFDFYMLPEQNYMTKRFSGHWTYVDNSFCACVEAVNSHFGISLAAVRDKIWILQCLNHDITDESIYDGIARFGSLQSIKYTYKLYNSYIYDVLFIMRDKPRYINTILRDSLFVSKDRYNCFRSATYGEKLYNVHDTSLMSDDQLKLYNLIDGIQNNGRQLL